MSLEPLIRFPVACPKCMRESLFHVPLKSINEALVTRNDISLSTACCGGVDWVASGIETEQIKQYVSLWRIPRLRTAHSDNSGLSNSNSAANIFANEEGSVLPNMMQVMNAITPGSQVVTSIEREVSR
jgi:hypothetical protein